MTVINRRNVVRSASVLFALPFTGALMPAYASEPTGTQNPSQPNRFKFSNSAGTAISPDFVNFVKDHSARVAAANHQGGSGDYAALGDQFHMLGKHLSLAGADKHIKAHCKKLLKTGTVPAIDPQALSHAVACVRTYAPSYSAKELLSTNAVPATPQEWAVQLKKLKKKGLVKCCHQAARQFNAMGHNAHMQGTEGSFKATAYDPNHSTQIAHLQEICSMSQKAKFYACIGATLLAGLIVLAAIVALCGATGVVACIGAAFPSATVGAAVFVAGFGLITGALLAACSAFLAASDHGRHRPSTALSAI